MARRDVRIVRVKAAKQGSETRHTKLLACSVKTGKRRTVADEVDVSEDVVTRADIDIVQGRFVGVRVIEQGAVGQAIAARVYDGVGSKLLHTTAECDQYSVGDDIGPDNVTFLRDGGLAFSCNRLLMYRKGASQLETLEAAGTNVRRLAVSNNPDQASQMLFWTVLKDGQETTKSLAL